MTALNGTEIAAEMLQEVRERLEGRVPVVRAITVAPTKATESYLRTKEAKAAEAGMRLEVAHLDADANEADVIEAIREPGADAIIVQLPLPEQLDTDTILAAIPPEKDPDVLSPHAIGLTPPVAGAVAAFLKRAGIDAAGKRAVVLGEGRLVGVPVAAWLRQNGAEVTVLNEVTFEAGKGALKAADIVVTGTGQPHLITAELLSPGVVLIDAGTSESRGAIVGDIDPTAYAVASFYTPVPGGVGPVTVACLFRNVAELLGA